MVAISHKHRFIFLKTRKTAGTSIEMALEPLCRPPGAIVTEQTPAIVTSYGVIGRRMRLRPKYDKYLFRRDWYNHMPAMTVRDAIGPEKWNSYLKITAVRDPFAQSVSRLHWRMNHRRVAAGDSLDWLRQKLKELLQGDEITFDYDLVHIDGKFVADRVIRFETLAANLAAVLQEVAPDYRPEAIAVTKDTGTRRAHPIADYFDAESIELVRKKARWIFDRFDYPEVPTGYPARTPGHSEVTG